MKKTHPKRRYSSSIKQSIIVNSDSKSAWRKISNIVGLPEWVNNVKKTVFLSKKKRGVGAKRNITFDDGSMIEEHVVAWKKDESFSYIALNGLPLSVYVATISIKKIKNKTKITWESYVISKITTQKKFNEFIKFMNTFYHDSLLTLKLVLEK